MNTIIERLLNSDEPSVRFKILVNVLDERRDSSKIRKLQEEIQVSGSVQTLLSQRDDKGRIPPAHHTYRKYVGAHWVLASLADIGYPPGDVSLIPLRDQVYDFWLSPEHISSVPIIQGRARRCASQQGNALYSTLALGLADERADQLARYLMRWQWPDGGWNCDRKPEAVNSSFWESLIPLRGLALYARETGNAEAKTSAARAAEVFLKRRLFKRQRDGQIMNEAFTKLHYPCYWYYDILFGLKVMAEAGFIQDARCQDALDLLQSKRLSDGGWPAEGRFYRRSKKLTSGCDLVSWGRVSKKRMNEFVTADALYVLKESGRLT